MTALILAALLLAYPAPAVGSPPPNAQIGGSATWCAPTPKYCQSWGEPAMLGAVHSFTWGDKPYWATVTWRGKSVVVRVVSFCACGSAVIDLSPAAFKMLAPLHVGRLHNVTVTYGGIRLPATDTAPDLAYWLKVVK
jgi:hypothetical protein